jgi:hypothetical protein
MQAPDGFTLYSPRGRSQSEDLDLLAECIANSKANLFNQDGSAIWIEGGNRTGVGTKVLADIIAKHVVTARPVQHGGSWTVEFCAIRSDEMTLRALLKEDGGLLRRLPKAPGEPRSLSEQQEREIRDRLRTGEPKYNLARSYNTDIEAIERLAR